MKTIILHFSEEDRPYLPVVKSIVQGRAQCYLDNSRPILLTDYLMKSRARNNAAIVSTSEALLQLVFPFADNPKISEYAGSFTERQGIWFLFVDPLANLVTTSIGKFIFQRFLDKIVAPELWLLEPVFKWELFQPSRLEYLNLFLENSTIIGVDIETRRNDPDRVITCMSFTGVQLSKNSMQVATVVVPFNSEYNIEVAKLFLSCSTAKVFQNGKYDIQYLFRYNCIPINYAFDTINLFHSWLSELPKDLGFISAFMLRTYVFHKNDGKTGDLMDYYGYNAKDTYTTVLCCIALLLEMPDYAINNFLMEFPVVFPCILSESTGIKYDSVQAALLKSYVEKDSAKELIELQTMLACKTYNPSSPPQTVRLWEVLGSKDIKATRPPDKDKVASRHPLNNRIVKSIISYRENMKLSSSYYKDGISWKGRCFYSLSPHGTDTGRLASKESAFWCGLQIQNIPRDEDGELAHSVKEAFIADEGFLIGEADYSQAESRGTGYLSGDTVLIAAVTDPTKDFHGVNASKFFGVPYEEIVHSYPTYDETGELIEWIHKTINKALRNDIGKRINHGANYNMGDRVLADTMGVAKVLLAKKLLKLPATWDILKVCSHLLSLFSSAYKILKGPYYSHIIQSVEQTSLLVGPTGWTRRCFGTPGKNKRHLNSYVAHPSQSLNAMILNKAYLKVFENIWKRHKENFKLCAQIHDSILFQYRIGHEYLAWEVEKQMKIAVDVTDPFKITRTMIVPVDIKGDATRWSEVKKLYRPR